MAKNPPAMQETRVRSLGQEEPLEKEVETHSSILAWEIPWTEEPGRLQSMGSQRQTRLSSHTLSFKSLPKVSFLQDISPDPHKLESFAWFSFASSVFLAFLKKKIF